MKNKFYVREIEDKYIVCVRAMTAHVDTHCRKKASFKREEKKNV